MPWIFLPGWAAISSDSKTKSGAWIKKSFQNVFRSWNELVPFDPWHYVSYHSTGFQELLDPRNSYPQAPYPSVSCSATNSKQNKLKDQNFITQLSSREITYSIASCNLWSSLFIVSSFRNCNNRIHVKIKKKRKEKKERISACLWRRTYHSTIVLWRTK